MCVSFYRDSRSPLTHCSINAATDTSWFYSLQSDYNYTNTEIVRLEGVHYDLMSRMCRDLLYNSPNFLRDRKSNFAIQFWRETRFSPWRHCDLISIALMQNFRTVGAGESGRTEIFIVCREKAG